VAGLANERLRAVGTSGAEKLENFAVVGLDIARIVAASLGRTEREEVDAILAR